MRRVSAPTGKWTQLDGGVCSLDLTHDVLFNTGIKPVPADFTITDASGVRVPLDVSWNTTKILRLLFAAPALVDPVWLTFPTSVPNYVTGNGFTMDPYGPILIPDPPLAKKALAEWTLTHPEPPSTDKTAFDAWIKKAADFWSSQL